MKRNQENIAKTAAITAEEVPPERPPPPIPPPPSDAALLGKAKSLSPPVIIPPRPTSASIETQTDPEGEAPIAVPAEYYYSSPIRLMSPPPLMSPEAFVQQTEQLITEIVEQKLMEREQKKQQQQMSLPRPTPVHEMETQTFEEQPIELSHGETQTILFPARSHYTQTDDTEPYEFITSPPPTPGIEIETQTISQYSNSAETQTFNYQILANRQTQTPAEFIRQLPTPGQAVETQTFPLPSPLPVETPPAISRCEADTQTTDLPMFLANMETQTTTGYGETEIPTSTHTVTTEETYKFERELIEKETRAPASAPAEDEKLLQEMETQTETMPISEPIVLLAQSPEIAKFYQNTACQTEEEVKLPENVSEYKTTETSPLLPLILRSEKIEFPTETKEQMAEPNQQSSTVFADFSPQIVEFEYGVNSKAQEMCIAAEEVIIAY